MDNKISDLTISDIEPCPLCGSPSHEITLASGTKTRIGINKKALEEVTEKVLSEWKKMFTEENSELPKQSS